MNAKEKAVRKAEAIEYLRKLLPAGSTVYTVVKSVSRSGMSRNIDCYCIDTGPMHREQEPEIRWIGGMVAHAIGTPQSGADWHRSAGFKVHGCGTDMGFHVVDSLRYAMGTRGEDGKLIPLKLQHRWL